MLEAIAAKQNANTGRSNGVERNLKSPLVLPKAQNITARTAPKASRNILLNSKKSVVIGRKNRGIEKTNALTIQLWARLNSFIPY